jgi:hypothetical protein
MLIDYESFDNVGSLTNLGMKGWTWGGASPQLGAFGRFGTDGVRSADNSVTFEKSYPGLNAATLIMGLAWQPTIYSSTTTVMAFYDSTAADYQMTLTWDGSGPPFNFKLHRGTRTGTVVGTGTFPLLTNVYYYVEMKVTFADSGGTAEVRVNGITDITYTGDTKNTANAYGNYIVFGEQVGVTRAWCDDYYLCDGTGSAPFNTFLGDVRVSSLLPSGNGNSSQWIGSDGNSTDNYALIDEPGAASSTDYVQAANVGDKDTYAMANLPSGAGTVYAVKPVIVATKTDAGSRSIASVVRSGTSEVDSANKALTASYQWLTDIRLDKPGGTGWTVADVNGMEVGQKVTV